MLTLLSLAEGGAILSTLVNPRANLVSRVGPHVKPDRWQIAIVQKQLGKSLRDRSVKAERLNLTRNYKHESSSLSRAFAFNEWGSSYINIIIVICYGET